MSQPIHAGTGRDDGDHLVRATIHDLTPTTAPAQNRVLDGSVKTTITPEQSAGRKAREVETEFVMDTNITCHDDSALYPDDSSYFADASGCDYGGYDDTSCDSDYGP